MVPFKKVITFVVSVRVGANMLMLLEQFTRVNGSTERNTGREN